MRLKEHSFFRFFVDTPDVTKLGGELAVDPAEQEYIVQRIGRDFEIATLLIEEIIPYSLEYFLGIRGKYAATKEAEAVLPPLSDEDDDSHSADHTGLTNNH